MDFDPQIVAQPNVTVNACYGGWARHEYTMPPIQWQQFMATGKSQMESHS